MNAVFDEIIEFVPSGRIYCVQYVFKVTVQPTLLKSKGLFSGKIGAGQVVCRVHL